MFSKLLNQQGHVTRQLFLLTMLCAFYQSSPVQAQVPTAPAQSFNVFLQNGATLINNETEGPVAMGGDLMLNGSYQVSTNNSGTFTVSGVNVTLVIGGKITYQGGNGITVDQNGYVKVGDLNGGVVWYTDENNAFSPIRITSTSDYNGSPSINLQANSQQLGVSAGNNPVAQSNVIDFNSAFSQMQSYSSGLSSFTDNANLTNSNGNTIPHTGLPNQVKITLNSGINVLNLNGSDMNNVTDFTYNNQPDANHVLVVNVNAPGTFNWSVYNSGGIGGQNCPYILYNFYNTTSLDIQGNGAVEGTVFSPFADISKTSNQSNIEGQIIAMSYYQSGGENHYFPFTTDIPNINGSSCTGFLTYTQGGWGADPHGNNPGTYLQDNFAGAFPSGLTIGCGSNFLYLSSSAAVNAFLPSGGTPSVLPSGTTIDPGGSISNTLAGQLVAATLNATFDTYDSSFSSNAINLNSLYITSGAFNGLTVADLLSEANKVIGGCSSDFTISDVNDALSSFNENYDNGNTDNGFLSCTPTTSCNLSLGGSSTDVTCHGSANGSINVTVSGAVGNVSYSWNDGATTQNRTGLGTGTYTVIVTDAGAPNCSSQKSFNIKEPDSLKVSGTTINVSITGGSDGSIDVLVSGGSSPYHYLWNDGITTEDRNGLTEGTYSVTVTDDHGCSATKGFTLTQPSCSIRASGSSTDITCHGSANGSINITVSGAQGNVSFLWSDGATTQNRNGLSAGIYGVTVTDNGGCSSDTSFTIKEPDSLIVNGSKTNVSITGGSDGSIDVTVTGGISPYHYLWSDGATTEDRSGLTAGTYSVTVTDDHGCSAGNSFTIGQPGCNLSVSGQQVNLKCHGSADGSISLSVTGAQGNVTYLWNDGVTTQNRSGLSAGVYSVTVTDGGSCTATTAFTITQPKSLSLSETHVDASTGNNGSITLTVTGGTKPYTYLWSNGSTSKSLKHLTPGTYSVVVTDANGCTAGTSVMIKQAECACIPPTNIHFSTVSSNKVQMCWSSVPCATGYYLKWKLSNKKVWKYRTVIAPDTCTIFTFLTDQSDQIYIATLCSNGDTSAYSPLYVYPPSQRIAAGTISEPEFGVYPNPTSGRFVIHFDAGDLNNETATVVVMNMLGAQILVKQLSLSEGILDQEVVLQTGLPEGMYVVQVTVGDKTYRKQIIYARQ